MIQKSYLITSEVELLHIIDWLKSDLAYQTARTTFVQVFLSRFDVVEAQTIVYSLKKAAPDIKIAGMSLYGDPLVGLNPVKSICFNFCFFEESEAQVLVYDTEQMTSFDSAEDIRKHLAAKKDAKGVLLFLSGLTFPASRFMQDVTRGYDDIPFFGALANINTSDVGSESPYAFGDFFVLQGVVAVIFSGASLNLYTESLFSWKPIGKEMEVTSCLQRNDGSIGDTLIKTIDGMPATEIYKKYLDVDPDEHFISNVCEFPIVVERKGYLMARVPCGYSDSGDLTTMGDIRNGEKVRFTYGKTHEILQKSEEASERMADFAPQAIFLYVCANRAIFLKDLAKEEIGYYLNVNTSLVYAHGFSELYRYKGQGGVFNSQLVTVGLREGDSAQITVSDERLALMGITFDAPQKKQPLPRRDGLHTINDVSLTHTMFQQPIFTPIPLSERLVTFLEATTDELKKMTQAANAASEAKSNFLSSMSHEIRTPINAVLGLDEMILRESSEQTIKGYARDIQSSGKSLLSIINDILDFSKIEAGKMEIINDDYDLRSTITDLANMVETRARNKGLDFIVDVDESMPHLFHGDETRIKQCALNILTNAVKYTPEGSVTLKVRFQKNDSSHGSVIFTVSDTGIGMKEEDLPKLFRPFERIEESRNRSIEGTGLGMSIVNGLLQQMHSKLEVRSVYGKGSDFSFALEQEVRDWEKIGSAQEARAALSAEAGSYTETFQAPNAHVLVIDDTPMNLTVIRGLLKPLRIQVDTADSGFAALELVHKNEYDVIFVDHLMPKMDGLAFIAENWSDPNSINKNTPMIALTANAVSGAREYYLSVGFDNYLSKPIDSKKLEALLAQYLPKELMLLPGDSGFVQQDSKHWDGIDRRSAGGSDELFGDLFGISIGEALKNCGDKDMLVAAVGDFVDAIEQKSAAIENYAAQNDWKDYTVQVHALKSSARLIGAMALSGAARELEACGDKAQKGDSDAVREIMERTPRLLSDYRAYKKRLSFLCGKDYEETKAEKPPISQTELKDALSALRESLSAFDFSTADAIISQMDAYQMPEGFADRFEKIRQAVRNVDAQAAKALLD